MFGGFEFNIEGVVGSVLVLFFTALLGVLFNNKTDQNKLNQLQTTSRLSLDLKKSTSSGEGNLEEYNIKS